jgi:hypothetical protein
MLTKLMELLMKFALIGAAIIATAALATPANAFPRVVSNPGYCAQFYPNANCQNYGPGNPHTGSYQARNGESNARMGRPHPCITIVECITASACVNE